MLLLATLAILGSPPFGLFLSELTIVRAGFTLSDPVLPALLLLLLVVAFVGALADRHRNGDRSVTRPVRAYATSSQRVLAGLPLMAGIAALLVLGCGYPRRPNQAIMTRSKDHMTDITATAGPGALADLPVTRTRTRASTGTRRAGRWPGRQRARAGRHTG